MENQKREPAETTEQFQIEGGRLVKCTQEYGTIRVPYGVTEIGEGAFEGVKSRLIMLPETVEIIGERAFSRCEYLMTVVFPSSLKTIGKGAFENCYILYLADLSKTGVEVIPDDAFRNSGLNFIHFPSGLREIGESAFEDCEELQELILPGQVTRVGNSAFTGCKNLARVVIPNSIQELEYDAFAFYAHNPDYMLLPKSYEPTEDEDISSFAFGYDYMYVDNEIHFYDETPDWDEVYGVM